MMPQSRLRIIEMKTSFGRANDGLGILNVGRKRVSRASGAHLRVGVIAVRPPPQTGNKSAEMTEPIDEGRALALPPRGIVAPFESCT